MGQGPGAQCMVRVYPDYSGEDPAQLHVPFVQFVPSLLSPTVTAMPRRPAAKSQAACMHIHSSCSSCRSRMSKGTILRAAAASEGTHLDRSGRPMGRR